MDRTTLSHGLAVVFGVEVALTAVIQELAGFALVLAVCGSMCCIGAGCQQLLTETDESAPIARPLVVIQGIGTVVFGAGVALSIA